MLIFAERHFVRSFIYVIICFNFLLTLILCDLDVIVLLDTIEWNLEGQEMALLMWLRQ